MGNAVTATRFNRYGHIPCSERIHGALIALQRSFVLIWSHPLFWSHAADAKRRDCNAIFHYKNSRNRDPCRPGRTGTFPPIIMMLHRRSLSAHCLFALFLIKCLLSSSFFWHIFQHVRSAKLLLASSADIAVSISAREKTTRTLSEEAK